VLKCVALAMALKADKCSVLVRSGRQVRSHRDATPYAEELEADRAGCGCSTFCRETQARNHARTLSIRFGTDSAMTRISKEKKRKKSEYISRHPPGSR
jgi:hypothetical protein